MAIARIASSSGINYTAFATSLAISRAVSASGGVLVGFIFCLGDNVNTVTDNGSATGVSQIFKNNITGSYYYYVYIVDNPATGTHNFAFNIGGGGADAGCAVFAYSGMSAAGQPDASATTFNTFVTTVTGTVNVATANSWAIMLAAWGPGQSNTLTASTGANLLVKDDTNGFGIFDSNSGLSTGNYSETVTSSSAGNPRVVIVSMKEGGGGAADEQPRIRRQGGTPHTGTTQLKGGHRGGPWGQTKSGLSIPNWLAEKEAA